MVRRLHAESTSMRYPIPLRLKTLRAPVWAPLRRNALLAVLATALFPALAVMAQSPAISAPPHAPTSKATKPSGSRLRPQAPAQAAESHLTPVPAAPPAPVWPVNQQAKPAHIVWNSHGLKIEASNSSLDQILHDVSTNTGVTVEGFGKDERIFGTYGPGPAREVLSRLLDGSGYNVLMVGGAGNAPPSRIVLSTQGLAGPQPPPGAQGKQQAEEETPEPEEPQPPEPEPMPVPQETPQPTPMRNPLGDMQRPMGGGPPTFGQPATMPPDQNNPQQQPQ